MERFARPRHGTVVAYLALFVALSGTSYAAATLSKNAVRSKHIKNGQVKRADLGDNAVTADKVLDGSLLAEDFKPGQLEAGGTATYSAGSGLSLSGTEFSVTGAPWQGLTGVPADFADGIDDVGSARWSDLTGVPSDLLDGDDNGSAGLTELRSQLKAVDGAPNGPTDLVSFTKLTDVPADLLDGDDDGSAVVAELRSELKANDGTSDEGNDLVSFTQLTDLSSPAGGRILSSFIQDGTISGADLGAGQIRASHLAGEYSGSTETIVGAVTSAKIADGTIQGRDLGPLVADATRFVDPPSVPAGTRVPVTLTIADVRLNDLVTVSPPADLEPGLLFAGSDVLVQGEVTVYLHNVTAAALDGSARPWKVRWLDTHG